MHAPLRMGFLLLAAILLLPGTAGAEPAGQRLREAREREAAARAEADAASAGLSALSRRYARTQARADRAAARLIDAYLAETEIQAEMARARSLLENRADAIYRAGPAAFLEVLLDSTSPGDLIAREKMIEGALGQGVEEANRALARRERARELRREVERRRAALVRQQTRLAAVRAVMEIRLADAQAEAAAAGARVQALVDQQRQLVQAAAAEHRYTELIQVDGDLGELLELLGPTGGRGCQIPPDLEPTGQILSGEASFYGEEFAGNPTAIGHIFNPALFTAAHKTMPLPSFLHVRYGTRCATVLVNDRGPYIDGRFLDLSEGAAMYLGLPGVGQVRAEILTPE